MANFGLIGKFLSHSFSKKYFQEKFENEGLTQHSFELFEMPRIDGIRELVAQKKLLGFSVTIPYKESIIPFLDELSESCKAIGAVNSVKVVTENGKQRLIGYNTDYLAFKASISPLLRTLNTKALILGTGGASKAVSYAIEELNIPFDLVSTSNKRLLSYDDLLGRIEQYLIIINTTPVGMYPKSNESLPFPFDEITENHLLYDLIYNPEETVFLKNGKKQSARIKSGLEMLYLQAKLSWEIWTKN